jgi:hypothetical protein
VAEHEWALVEEIGIGHGGVSAAPAGPALEFPVYAERAGDGSTLVLDKLAIAKSVPYRLEYRTLRVSPRGEVLADSRTWGIDDGYGLLDAASLVLLRVACWELAVFGDGGTRLATVDLSRVSKRMPLLASLTERGTFLLAFGERVFDVELVEVDSDGAVIWRLDADPERIGYPGTVQALPDGYLLVADEFCHVVSVLARDGSVVDRLGSWRDPGRRGGRLSSPRGAWRGPDGRTLVADTRNDRVLELVDGAAVELTSPAEALSGPTFAAPLPGGRALVCDAGNRRVVELGPEGEVLWAFGAVPARRLFSFPRSVEALAGGGVLVADTAHDRVVTLEAGAHKTWPLVGDELFWPRCARVLPSGSLLVADGRNGRVIEVSPGGRVERELRTIRLEPPLELRDPHDVRALADGRLIVTDAQLDMVVEVDWSGRVTRVVGGPTGAVRLADPHSAQLLAGGELLICDSGGDRLVWVGADGAVARELRTLHAGGRLWRLRRPRHAELAPCGLLVVCDTANNRVLAAEPSGELVWELTDVPGSPVPRLHQPRWAHLLARDDVLVVDHYHHRVLRLRRDA